MISHRTRKYICRLTGSLGFHNGANVSEKLVPAALIKRKTPVVEPVE